MPVRPIYSQLPDWVRLTLLSIRKGNLPPQVWTILAILLFTFLSSTLAEKVGPSPAIALFDPREVAKTVSSIGLFTRSIEEKPEQVEIALTGETFVVSTDSSFLPKEYTHTIAKGETLASIAQAYDVYVSDILKANDIRAEDAAKVKVGQVVRIPAEAGEQDLTWLQLANEARRKAEEEARRARLAALQGPRTVFTRSLGGGNVEILGRQARGSNTYPFGWCTYWVASKRYVPPRWGNAKSWLSSARAAGWATGSEPRAGAIVVTTDNRFYGHVAYVEAVGSGSITVSEMNYVRWGVVNRRTIPIGSPIIRGYIY